MPRIVSIETWQVTSDQTIALRGPLMSNELEFSMRYQGVANKGVSRRLKRQLLNELGFPLDRVFEDVTARLNDREIDGLFDECKQTGMYLVTFLPEGERLTYGIPPFFEVVAPGVVFSRIGHGLRRVETKDILYTISRLPRQSTVYRTSRIWGKQTIAGRFMYLGDEEQRLEIEAATVPRLMGLDTTRISLALKVDQFEVESNSRRGNDILGKAADHLCGVFKSKRQSFRQLLSIAPNPTLEFALTNTKELYIVDVDWATQWTLN